MAVAILLLPDALGRLFGIAAEITFYSVYPRLQKQEFDLWQSANPGLLPLNGWRAIGWGFLGLFLFFAIAMVIIIPLMMLFPSLQ